MPPKSKDDAPKPKKKAEVPKELCGCGVNTYRAPPKGKKKSAATIEHNAGCSFQRATCNRYPNLPRCATCEEGCAYCAGINQWCPHCMDNKCKFLFKRNVLGWPRREDLAAVRTSAGDGAATGGMMPPSSASAAAAKK